MKKKLLVLFIIISSQLTFSQETTATDWKELSEIKYAINYPETWTLDTSGQMNTKFLLFSKMEDDDTFRENINLLVQDLSATKMDLKAFVELSENHITTMVPDGVLIKSSTQEKNNMSYHESIWKGKVSSNNLHFKQYYFIKDNSAYILTFTALQSTFTEFISEATKILDSFKLN